MNSKNSPTLLRYILLFFLLGIGVQNTFAQLKKRNSRIEVMSSSFVGIQNYGIISGGPMLSFTQKVNGKMEIGCYAGNTYGIQSNKLRLFIGRSSGNGITQISQLQELGVFANFYMKQYTGSTAPIGLHLTAGLGFGTMKIDHILNESSEDFPDRPRWNFSTNDHLRVLLGIGKTTQFASHFTVRGMISMSPYIKLNKEELDELPETLREIGYRELPEGPSSPYSLFSIQFALGYQF